MHETTGNCLGGINQIYFMQKTFSVSSSNGELHVDISTGIVTYCRVDENGDKAIANITKFDLEEWKRTYRKEIQEHDNIDILDLGYWYKETPVMRGGETKYEHPAYDWRDMRSFDWYAGKIEHQWQVRVFFQHLMEKEALNFHPDTPFNDYIHGETKQPLYHEEQATFRDKLMEQCFDFCTASALDIYEIANEEFKKYTDKNKDIDDEGNCIYCGKQCYKGQGCDEYNAGGFNEG